MKISSPPSTLNPDLAEEYLILIAQLIVDTYNFTLDEHDPGKGDGAWSLGCRSYERTLNKLKEKVFSKEWEWLGINPYNKSVLKFLFTIKDTTIRYFRCHSDMPQEIKDKLLSRKNRHVRQLSLFNEDTQEQSIIWYLVVNLGLEKEILSITCFGLDVYSDEVVCEWDIPFKSRQLLLVNVNSLRQEPVEVPAPEVALISDEMKQKEKG